MGEQEDIKIKELKEHIEFLKNQNTFLQFQLSFPVWKAGIEKSKEVIEEDKQGICYLEDCISYSLERNNRCNLFYEVTNCKHFNREEE